LTVPRAGTRFASVAALLLMSSLLVSFAAPARTRSCFGASPTIVGSNRSEIIHGTPGNDVIMGRRGRDRIWGGGGDDLICGGAGADIIRAGPGRDRVDGGRGTDIVRAGADDDILRGGNGRDFLSGGSGTDELDLSASPRGVRVDLGRGTVVGKGTDPVIGIENVRGSSFDDVLIGDEDGNQLVGGPGNDRLVGGPGNDLLLGDGGADILRGGDGDDALDGGEGDDTLYGGPGSDAIDGGAGVNTCSGGEQQTGCGVGVGGPGGLTGTWVLIQVVGATQLNNQSQWISDALTDVPTRGLSLRVPWNAMSDSLLDTGKAIADAAGKAFSIRFMAGRYTPQAVFDAGSPSYTANGNRVPTPFFSDGSPNTIFESFFESEVAHLAGYCRSHGIHLLHLPWYGLDWAELNNGAEVRAAPGYSQAAFINAHERLIDIALRYAGDDLAVEFPMSGHGPLDQVGAALADHIVSVAGANSARIYVQSNGLAADGDWGAPNQETERSMDDAVWSRAVRRGEQMIQPGDYDWAQVFANPIANGADYVEVYIESFRGNNAAQLSAQIAAFAQRLG
jgi:RTX calcium-binding nonapeptide repeat (4 copies)